ncbi:MAG: hypothetical protein U9O82_10405, partial [Thermodesulfobacteriota bacterium]|nr:hypothetical protein [Thermodesulfobacteriota bacterium]
FFPHFALTFFARTNKFVHATHQAVTKNGARLSSPKSVIIRKKILNLTAMPFRVISNHQNSIARVEKNSGPGQLGIMK